jgi:hypothetical protein
MIPSTYSFVVFTADKATAVTLMIEMGSGMAERIRAEYNPLPALPCCQGGKLYYRHREIYGRR